MGCLFVLQSKILLVFIIFIFWLAQKEFKLVVGLFVCCVFCCCCSWGINIYFIFGLYYRTSVVWTYFSSTRCTRALVTYRFTEQTEMREDTHILPSQRESEWVREREYSTHSITPPDLQPILYEIKGRPFSLTHTPIYEMVYDVRSTWRKRENSSHSQCTQALFEPERRECERN